jgi:hypothetical protein
VKAIPLHAGEACGVRAMDDPEKHALLVVENA